MAIIKEQTGGMKITAPRNQIDPNRFFQTLKNGLRRVLLSEYFVFYLMVVYFIILVPFLPTLSKPANITNILSNTWPLLLVAIGQTFVLIIAGIDLSQGAVIGLTSVVGAALMATAASEDVLSNSPLWDVVISTEGGLLAENQWAVPLAILAMALVGILVGFFNGTAIARFNMPPFMVTLVALMFFSALAIYLTQSENIRNLPESYINLGKGDLVSVYFGEKVVSKIPRREIYPFITYAMVISVSLAVVAHVILSRTIFGKQVYAMGTNKKAAAVSGVPIKRVIITVYMLSAFYATMGGLLYSARLEAGRPTLGAGTFLLDVIGATVIGGTSLFGGKGKVLWTFFGVLFFVLLSNTLNLMNLSAFYIDMVKGSVILAAALIDVIRTRLATVRS